MSRRIANYHACAHVCGLSPPVCSSLSPSLSPMILSEGRTERARAPRPSSSSSSSSLSSSSSSLERRLAPESEEDGISQARASPPSVRAGERRKRENEK
jgi:hypothetical protein